MAWDWTTSTQWSATVRSQSLLLIWFCSFGTLRFSNPVNYFHSESLLIGGESYCCRCCWAPSLGVCLSQLNFGTGLKKKLPFQMIEGLAYVFLLRSVLDRIVKTSIAEDITTEHTGHQSAVLHKLCVFLCDRKLIRLRLYSKRTIVVAPFQRQLINPVPGHACAVANRRIE